MKKEYILNHDDEKFAEKKKQIYSAGKVVAVEIHSTYNKYIVEVKKKKKTSTEAK